MKVIDGMHRLRACRLNEQKSVEVILVDASDEDAFVVAVESNTKHGLPLSRSDREAATHRILRSHPAWSDRAIATVTGLSAGTVATIRKRSTAKTEQSNSRIGRDGRVRPVNGLAGRRRAAEVVTACPNASLRQIAKEAGVSVGTARSVRRTILRQDPTPIGPVVVAARPRDAETSRPAEDSGRPPSHRTAKKVGWDWESTKPLLADDPSVRYSEQGRGLVKWFDRHATEIREWRAFADAVPAHWAAQLAHLARQYAREWELLAGRLEGRRTATGKERG
jgi:hypothetical protein